jgi:8-oxo-dGTP pyrophosphatase MutT (NUDIX family)
MESFIDNLRLALKKPLPGQDAQAIMMPSMSDKSRFSLEARKGARPGGVMILFYEDNGSWYFPLIQRPDYDGVHAKQMSFPGGKKDKADIDLISTALRETEEEVGIKQNQINVIGSLSELYIIASNFNVLPTIGFLQEPPNFEADEHEVDEIISVKIEDLMNDSLQKEKPLTILQGITINAPYFDLNNKVVWGATAMMLSELKIILKPYFSG